MSSLPLLIIDAFTDEPFRGNPAAVCLLDRRMPASWMQAVATEMNLSETAFVRPTENGYSLQWFTPVCEVDLCGHATLAATRAMLATNKLHGDDRIAFATRSGLLHAWVEDGWIVIDLPADRGTRIAPPDGLAQALGATPLVVQQHKNALLVEMADEATVLAMNPDFDALAAIETDAFFVSAAASREGCDFVSRMFGPRLGINEDPVTGAAHCAYGPYWQKKLGRDDLIGFQASKRGGFVKVKSIAERVQLAGKSTVILRGQFLALPEDATSLAAPPYVSG